MAKILFLQKGRTIYSGDSALKLPLFYGSCRTAGDRTSPLFTGTQKTNLQISVPNWKTHIQNNKYIQRRLRDVRIKATYIKPSDHGRNFKICCFETLHNTASRMRQQVLLVESSKIFAIWGV